VDSVASFIFSDRRVRADGSEAGTVRPNVMPPLPLRGAPRSVQVRGHSGPRRTRELGPLSHWRQMLSRPEVLGQTFDDRHDVIALKSEPPSLRQQLLRLRPDNAAFGFA